MGMLDEVSEGKSILKASVVFLLLCYGHQDERLNFLLFLALGIERVLFPFFFLARLLG